MIGSRLLASIIALGVVLCLVGCSNKQVQPHDPLRGELPMSIPGRQRCAEARQIWNELNSKDVLGPARAAGIQEVIEKLEAACSLDPYAPLPMTLKAYMHLQFDQFEEAEALFPKTLGPATKQATGSQDWAPGYLGLARVALARKETTKVLAFAKTARQAADAVQGKDPRIPDSVKKVLAEQMSELETWAEDIPPGTRSLDPDGVKRAVAEARLLEVLCSSDAKNPEAFEAVLAIDRNYFPARREQAELYAKAGDHSKVIATMEGFALESGNPKLANNVNYQYMVAHAYSGRYQAEGKKGDLERAQFLLQLVMVRHPEHAPAKVDDLLNRTFALERKHRWNRVGNLPDTVQQVFDDLNALGTHEVVEKWNKQPLPGFTPDSDLEILNPKVQSVRTRLEALRKGAP